MTQERKNLGRIGEEEAVRFLKKKGCKILARNYETKFGEIDIVASKDGAIIFVEVKTRVSGLDEPDFLPEDNIDWRKQEKLTKLGEYYLLANNYPDNQEWQIDVVAVEVDPWSEKTEIRHIEKAVSN